MLRRVVIVRSAPAATGGNRELSARGSPHPPFGVLPPFSVFTKTQRGKGSMAPSSPRSRGRWPANAGRRGERQAQCFNLSTTPTRSLSKREAPPHSQYPRDWPKTVTLTNLEGHWIYEKWWVSRQVMIVS